MHRPFSGPQAALGGDLAKPRDQLAVVHSAVVKPSVSIDRDMVYLTMV